MTRDLLIRILSDWSVRQSAKIDALTAPDAPFSVQDFMDVTEALFALKGITGETITIEGKPKEL